MISPLPVPVLVHLQRLRQCRLAQVMLLEEPSGLFDGDFELADRHPLQHWKADCEAAGHDKVYQPQEASSLSCDFEVETSVGRKHLAGKEDRQVAQRDGS